MSKVKEIFRPTIESDQIYALLDIMDSARRGDKLEGLNPVLKSYYDKLNVQAFKIGNGSARPAYVSTGIRKESAVNLDSLGATEKEKKKVREFDGMSEDEIGDELERLNNEMLKELGLPTAPVADSGGPSSEVFQVVYDSGDEIDSSSIGSDSNPTDNDNMHQLFMNATSNVTSE